jgi:hypothetical protein
MGQIHEGVCGSYQSAYKMKWVIRRNGYFWPTMLEDCFTYYKGCKECKKFGNVQRAPASAMTLIINPWPFRGWWIDLIEQIYPPSSKNHKFILVATDCFTKWVEAIPLKTMTSKEMIEFVKEHIIYRFEFHRPLWPVTPKMNKGKNMLSAWESVKLIAKINFFIHGSNGKNAHYGCVELVECILFDYLHDAFGVRIKEL